MPPPPGPDPLRRPDSSLTSDSPFKPPLPTLPSRLAQHARSIEIQLPPLIAGSLIAAFAAALAQSLDNPLLAHYYLPEQKVRVNLDRVIDRLLAAFTAQLWDELFRFYHAQDRHHHRGPEDPPSRQVRLLFDGPVRQLVLVLNGPETARCLLDKIGPGLSRRPRSWSAHAAGIDLPLALQLLCGYWHREFPSQSPGGSPDDIARSLHSYIVGGDAAARLVAAVRDLLLSPHHVQMHLMESAVWDFALKRPGPPPVDGFLLAQFSFECRLSGAPAAVGDSGIAPLGSLLAITGTAANCAGSTVADYVSWRWPKRGALVLSCLQEAVAAATHASRRGEPFAGMSVWDDALPCAGLRLLHVEVEDAAVRVGASAWTHALIEVLQQMAWTCAALSASPFRGALAEAAVEVADWAYLDGSVYVNCSLVHRPVPEGEGMSWLQPLRGAAIATGFPVDEPSSAVS